MSGKTNLLRDASRKALPAGRRVSKDGNVYYENRANRADRGTYGKYHLAEGGYLTDPNFGQFQNMMFADGGDVDGEFFTWKYAPNDDSYKTVIIYKTNVDDENSYDSVEQIKEQLRKEGVRNFIEKSNYARGGRFEAKNWINYDKDHLMNKENGMIVLKGTNLKDIQPKDIKGFDMLSNKGYARGGGVDYYEQLEVFVQGEGSIYKGTSMKKAIESAEMYLIKNPNAEITIVDIKYGDEYDMDGNLIEEYRKGGALTNERRHVNHEQDYEVRYARTRPSRTGYKGKRSFSGGGDVKKQQLKKGDDVLIIGRRWFDRINGNTYHTAEVIVNDKVIGKSRMTYGYEEQYIQTGKEILLEHFELPKGMKESSPLWQLREYGVEFRKRVTDGLKRDLELGGNVGGYDLAGHLDGTLNVGQDDGMLSGVTGTQYSGLVGETGAMSSGEMFARGGKVSPFKNIMETNTITQKEINLIKMRMNNDKVDEDTQEVIDYIWDNSPQLTPDQNKKGIDYLRNLWKSPTGKERNNNPFGYREQDALETFEYFELRGFYDAGNMYRKFYVPLYTCVGADSSFEYAVYGGEVNILG